MSLGNNMILASGAVIEPENVSIPVLTPRDETFTITVVNSGGNKFYANGQNSLYVQLYQGFTYKFDQSDASNSSHPLVFSTTEDGSNYTTGVSSLEHQVKLVLILKLSWIILLQQLYG